MSAENDATVEYEVWRSHPNGRDVRVYFGLSEEDGPTTLALCNKDKAEAYPDAPIEFYLVRVTRTRERVVIPSEPSAENGLRRSAARRGTVCDHCWLYWRQEPGHSKGKCRDVWTDPDSPNGLTVCMCNCVTPPGTGDTDERRE